jgi:hypothetical protein
VTVQIDLDIETGSIRGQLRDGDAGPRPFDGWLELINALEEWRANVLATPSGRA